MRFASLGGQSNYAQAGKAVADDATRTFKAARRNSVDFGGLSQTAMKVKAEENIAQTRADSLVDRANIDANKTEKLHDAKMQTAKAGVMRKAGGLIALGMDGFRKEEKSDYSSMRERIERDRNKATEFQAQADAIDLTPKPAATSAPTTSSSGELISSGQALSAGKGTSGSGGKYDLSAMTNYAIKGGFSPENARIMAAISMGESGGNAGIDTVQSGLDPNQTNEFSVGLSQINVQAHGDKLSRRGWTQEDLRDPVKNMTIAKEVYDEVGSFKPWSVYQKGLHHQYLQ